MNPIVQCHVGSGVMGANIKAPRQGKQAKPLYMSLQDRPRGHELHAPRSISRIAAITALTQMQMPRKVFAINAGITESELSNAITGRRHFEADWLMKQGPDFLNFFWDSVCKQVGLVKPSKHDLCMAKLRTLNNAMMDLMESMA